MREAQTYHHGDLRAALLTAAESELADSGVEGFSLRGVARRAGVSHAAPAHHFGDVNGLLTALAALSFERFTVAMETAAATARPDPLSQVVAIGMGYIDYAAGNPHLFGLQFASERPNWDDAALKQHAEAAFGSLKVRVEALARTLGRDAEAVADVMIPKFWATTHGLATLFAMREFKGFMARDPQDRRARFERILRSIVATA